MKRTAFTLLELLLVLAIIAAICGLGITSYQRQYARSQFKSGVVQIQVDLHKTRLLAMQSGEAYLFRYVPGTGVYEIAPLKTLQEVLYRIYGDAEDSSDSALGGSMSLSSSPSLDFSSDSAYSDDLFSSENIAADIAASKRALSDANQTTFGNDSPSLGGSFASTQSGTFGEASNANWNSLNGNIDAFSNGAFGNEGFASSGTALGGTTETIDFRELNAQEKSLAKENSLAWRVNSDGVVIRKQATGDVVFTILCVSKSTPSNLRTQRPKGSNKGNSQEAPGSKSNADNSEIALGGSLTSVPDGSDADDELGGGFNKISGETNAIDESSDISEEKQTTSLWSEPIIFYPNGKTSSAVFGLASVGDYSYYSEIAIRGMTGVARISSISSVPPGANPRSSVLTREQLFRLSNPTNESALSSNTDATTSDSFNGALGEASTAPADYASNSFGELNELNAPTNDFSTEERRTSSVDYGTGRRSGYNFNESASSTTNDDPLGVSLDQGATSQLNVPIGADSSNESSSEFKQTGSSVKNSTLNGGAL